MNPAFAPPPDYTRREAEAMALRRGGLRVRRPQTDVMKLLARDVLAARKRLHMTVRVLASQIGISESALRRIENGTSQNTRSETGLAILIWAGSRGYREFAGFSIAPSAPSAEETAQMPLLATQARRQFNIPA